MKQFLGFTLSELLVSLAVIGVIAAVSIPKIIGDTSRNQSRIQLKEALNAIESIAMQGFADEEIVENNSGSLTTYVMDNIRNVNRICRNNARTEGCAGATATLHWSNGAAPGILLNNGSLIVFQSSPGGTAVGGSQIMAGPNAGPTGEPNTCMYIMAYDSAVNAGQQWNPNTNSSHLPLVIREGNARGGLGTLFKNDYIWNTDSRWLYQ
jgi:prepilin-type N-terminal cleavage/methylation domain-containing protein